jgi:REP element-mobilizing transposase RayT
MEPIYTPMTVKAAYQLRWSLSLFAKKRLPSIETWLDELKQVVERDGVRILESRLRSGGTLQFFLSTQPEIAPPEIVRSVKGRLQHSIQMTTPNAFRRNFLLTSVGDAKRQVVEDYVASQLCHHHMVDERVNAVLNKFQMEFPEVDLSQKQTTAHGSYLYNLHLVLVHSGRWNEIREDELACCRDMVTRVARNKGHRISRLALLSDHLHLVVGVPPDTAPRDVALGYLNNLAYAHGMKELYSQSYYTGTVGEYDSWAIRMGMESTP